MKDAPLVDAPKIEMKVNIWVVAVALVAATIGYGKLHSDVGALKNNDVRVDTVNNAVNELKTRSAATDERVRALDDKINRLIYTLDKLVDKLERK